MAEGTPEPGKAPAQTALGRLGWFAFLWLASVLALGAVAYAIKLMLRT